ncbi:ABC transporter substrate-binding protein [Variovorax sp. J22P240]|uniref:ABC transporter substrate-binding protein n=1 Tax=unclassified Variovorax TaxID=663243 RepID=UPI0025790FC5|nr:MULTISPECIES: ABC transporter substrate-binding protein [unclassified Variovorax]MDM0002966.1 ABC transporter substrate-binding protein [Variovorax sp. J22P240]MDM0050379.1 ABC transporter substrate-binding protein [Variovorax sp. J22R115]
MNALKRWFATGVALCAMLGAANASAQDCPKLGGVLALTGAQGAIGKVIADAGKLAVDQVNKAGGVKGCQVDFALRDDTSQPSVGVDAARYLVDVQKVSAVVGLVGSGTALAVVNSVSVPNKVPTVACCAVTPSLTKMAQEGKTDGYFFRTIPTARTMALAHAQAVMDKGYKKTVIMYINNDFGTGVAPDAKKAIEKLGGNVVGMVAYNENQPSYRSEVNKALALEPDSLVLVGLSQDGTIILREWFSLGGTPNVILHNTLRSMDVVKGIGERFLTKAVGVDNGQASGPTADAFNKDFTAAYNRPAVGPGLHTMYDAVAVTLLAMQAAPKLDGPSIRDALRAVQDPAGLEVGPGVEGLKKGLDALKAGKKIRYVGATGGFRFDKNGDVTGPMLIWKISNGEIVTEKTLTLEEMNALEQKVGL